MIKGEILPCQNDFNIMNSDKQAEDVTFLWILRDRTHECDFHSGGDGGCERGEWEVDDSYKGPLFPESDRSVPLFAWAVKGTDNSRL
ncbi:hypothetical protein CEXT_30741 [Caerostris extrusa]|uniref:Uncharacterized protein n=1 Tax=Caerostris extrusa TaxID=172846 RepID=A0AAV4R4S2_CAEEX|nr:hypothetical protein CEXT_30741 [Caerostris extrusa]